jgi:outer membrane protein TolC
MLQYESHSLDARRKMVTSMGYPMLGLGVNYSLINKSEMSTSSMNGKDMIMPMVTITLPIYRKKYKSMVSETDFLKQANEQNYKATANSLESEYFEAVQSYQDALSKMKLYSKQSQLTKQTLELLMSSFSGSGSGLTDLLRIRQQLLEYQLKQIEAISDYNTDIAWIKRLTDCIQIK